MKKTLRVSKIKRGTVIDHVTCGHGLDVVRILRISGHHGGAVTIALNVPSGKLGAKDVVKIEGRELSGEEVDKIALLAPKATINIVRDYRVVRKELVKLPNVLIDIIRCGNPACVSNSNEPITPKFYVDQSEPVRLRCHYCSFIMEKSDVLKQF